MSQKSMGKTTDEVYLDLLAEFRKSHPGPVRFEDVGDWIDAQRLLPPPKVNAARVHTRKLKQAARRKRMMDASGRKVRVWLAAKLERFSANGQKVFDVIWDQLHEMSLDHALTSFEQRDEIIGKQQRAATRDVQSCLEFNENVAGHESLFVFKFMTEEAVPVVSETIPESAIPSQSDETDWRPKQSR